MCVHRNFGVQRVGVRGQGNNFFKQMQVRDGTT